MTEAEERLAARLTADVQAVLGIGVVVERVSLAEDGRARIAATCFVDGRMTEVAVEGDTLSDASQALIRTAAELRLRGAWNRMIAPL